MDDLRLVHFRMSRKKSTPVTKTNANIPIETPTIAPVLCENPLSVLPPEPRTPDVTGAPTSIVVLVSPAEVRKVVCVYNVDEASVVNEVRVNVVVSLLVLVLVVVVVLVFVFGTPVVVLEVVEVVEVVVVVVVLVLVVVVVEVVVVVVVVVEVLVVLVDEVVVSEVVVVIVVEVVGSSPPSSRLTPTARGPKETPTPA